MVSDAVLQISILFIPGIIWAQIDSVYARRRKPSEFEFIVNVLLFGLVGYTAAFLLGKIAGIRFDLPKLSTSATQIDLAATAGQLLLPLVSATVLSVIWCYLVNYSIFTKLMTWISASKSLGNQDVWEFTFNSNDKTSDYVNIRDYNNELIYTGYVRAWSGADQTREILLMDVRVYSEDSEMLYEMPMMYFSREKEHITIEFPTIVKVEKENVSKRHIKERADSR